MEVPLRSSWVESDTRDEDTMLAPGAITSTQEPWLENAVLNVSPVDDDATEMTLGDRAGASEHANTASLPPAATTTMLESTALSAKDTMEDPAEAGAPRDRLMTVGRRGDLPTICSPTPPQTRTRRHTHNERELGVAAGAAPANAPP